jgi:hypothetical protein
MLGSRACPLLVPLAVLMTTVPPALAAPLEVGPGKPYATPCQAINAAAPGDIIQIDAAGKYDGDVCAWSTSGLTLRGVGGGRARIDAAGQSAQGKAIWVIAGDDTTIENIELSGAKVVDKNGAGIRQEGKNLTVRGCFFHDNEDGILAGDSAGSEILIERSEFADNGAGDGYSHNMYINHIKKFTIQFSYSHGAKEGHLIKSRAAENFILYNRLSSEATGTTSYEINLPNGGRSLVIGNLIEQGPLSPNGAILDYGSEGPGAGQANDLFVVNNTFVNDRKSGGTFLQIAAGVGAVLARNNLFLGSGSITKQASVTLDHNFTSADGDPKLADPASYDYHLTPGSPCAEAGADPGMGDGQALTPLFHYVHPSSSEGRKTVGTLDIGAYELGGGSGGGAGSGSGSGSASGSGSGSGAGSGGGQSQGSGGAGAEGDAGGCGCRAAGEAPEGARIGLAAALAIAAGRFRARRTGRRRSARGPAV